jgi:hypothetical protein
MRHTLLVLATTLLATAAPRAQSGFDRSRLFMGGSFGARLGSNTLVNLSPQVGYHFSDHFAAGAGVNCIASSLTFRASGGARLYRESFGYAGLNTFARVYPMRAIFFSAQPEYNYSWGRVRYFNGQPDVKSPGAFVPCLLLGAGAVLPASRGSLIAMVQYDVAGNERSPYGRNPFVSMGFNF